MKMNFYEAKAVKVNIITGSCFSKMECRRGGGGSTPDESESLLELY